MTTYRWFESQTLPECISVFGVDWTVSGARCPTQAEAGNSGQTDCSTKEMWINGALRPQNLWRHYLHEVVHVLGDALNIGLTEHQVLLLETGLAGFFVENGVVIEQEEKP
jgi:hypothetical protein